MLLMKLEANRLLAYFSIKSQSKETADLGLLKGKKLLIT